MKKFWRISSLKYVAAFLLPAIFVLLLRHGLDNDSWYVLAEGRQIVENGVYYTDTLSMHEGLNVTVQNYGFAVLFYLLFSVFGAPGVYVMMLVLNFAICFLLYKICMLLSNKNTNLSLFIMMVTDLLLVFGFATTRAQMVSYVILLLLIYILELFVKTNKAKLLWWLPVLSLVQINLHASLWWILIAVVGVFIIDSFKKPKLHFEGYRTKPLVVAILAMLLVGLLNPYGIKMITFIFTSYGDAVLESTVVELSSYSPFLNTFSIFLYLSVVAVLVLYIFGKKENVRIRYLLMFFGFLALGLNTIKGMSQFVLTMFFPLALVYKDVRIESLIDAKIGRDALVLWFGVWTLCFFVVLAPVVVSSVEEHPRMALVEAVDAIDEDAKENIALYKVYTNYNDGGYAEFRGYKSYIDPRGEVFLKKNNGSNDILAEWYDLQHGKVEQSDFLDKYNFDYLLLTSKTDSLYDYEDEKYALIFENDDEEIKVLKLLK